MGLFEKKFCDFCGEKIGLLGNHKLEDGNMCGTCNKKISPFFNGRRKTTVEEMKQHFAEREQNRAKLPQFVVGSTFGESQKIYIDATGQNFIVSYSSPAGFEKENPDILPISAITACNTDIKENREEEYTKDANGNRVSYNPPRYRYFYDFKITINLNWRWFNEITVKLNSTKVEGLNSAHYHTYDVMLGQARAALLGQQYVPTTGAYGQQGYGQQGYGQQSFGQQFVDTVATAAAAGTIAMNGSQYGTQQNQPYGQNAPYGAQNQPYGQNAPYGAQNQPYGQNAPYGAQNQPYGQNAPYGAQNQPYGQNAPYGAQNQPYGQNAPYGAQNQPYGQNAPYGASDPTAQGNQNAFWTCPSCGVNNDTAFCRNCGQPKPAQMKFCTNCGWKAEAENAPNFCPQCGTKLQ